MASKRKKVAKRKRAPRRAIDYMAWCNLVADVVRLQNQHAELIRSLNQAFNVLQQHDQRIHAFEAVPAEQPPPPAEPASRYNLTPSAAELEGLRMIVRLVEADLQADRQRFGEDHPAWAGLSHLDALIQIWARSHAE